MPSVDKSGWLFIPPPKGAVMSKPAALVLSIRNSLESSGNKLLLERHGYRVLTVTSLDTGVSALREAPVDAVVIDADVEIGDSVVRRMKEIRPGAPILVICRTASDAALAAIKVDKTILQPNVPSHLAEVLGEMLAMRPPFFACWLENWRRHLEAIRPPDGNKSGAAGRALRRAGSHN